MQAQPCTHCADPAVNQGRDCACSQAATRATLLALTAPLRRISLRGWVWLGALAFSALAWWGVITVLRAIDWRAAGAVLTTLMAHPTLALITGLLLLLVGVSVGWSLRAPPPRDFSDTHTLLAPMRTARADLIELQVRELWQTPAHRCGTAYPSPPDAASPRRVRAGSCPAPHQIGNAQRRA